MKQLNWKADDSILLVYTPHIWRYIENTFEQFVTGTHSMTKAYQDYLSLTDDFDYCWGPVIEGETGEERLWATYVKNSGEVFILQANVDCTGWEREEFLVYAPSGSKKAAICFNSSGQYEIALEIIPLQSDPEVWIMSPPYYEQAIRKICNGVSPKVVSYHGEIILFYQPVVDRAKIAYRMSSDNYITEHIVDVVSTVNSVDLRKVIQFSSLEKDCLVLFYYQNGDAEPLKYVTSSPVLKDRLSPKVELSSVQWVQIITKAKELLEDVQLEVGVASLVWEVLSTTHEKNINENIETCVAINAISWQVVTTHEMVYQENPEVSIGVQNILWIIM